MPQLPPCDKCATFDNGCKGSSYSFTRHVTSRTHYIARTDRSYQSIVRCIYGPRATKNGPQSKFLSFHG